MLTMFCTVRTIAGSRASAYSLQATAASCRCNKCRVMLHWTGTCQEHLLKRFLLWLQAIARPMYSNPPLHGALLVKEILGDAALKQQ